MLRFLACAALLAIATPVLSQHERSVRDWTGGCDNTRLCRLTGLAPEGEAIWSYLTFERGGGGDDTVTQIRIVFDRSLAAGGEWTLRREGEPLFSLQQAQLECHPEGCEGARISDAGQIDALLAEFRRAERLSVDREGEVAALVSLSGATAMLLWVDEQQRRLDTQGAFVRRGDRAVSAPPPPVPSVAAERDAWQRLDDETTRTLLASARAGLGPDACDDGGPVAMDDAAWQHRSGRHLVALGCWAGAYNISHLWLWREGDEAWVPAAFQRIDEAPGVTPDDDGSLVNGDFDPEHGTVHAFSKGRGLGDCGSVHVWQWDGARFALLSHHAMPQCRGVRVEDWPRLWVAEPR